MRQVIKKEKSKIKEYQNEMRDNIEYNIRMLNSMKLMSLKDKSNNNKIKNKDNILWEERITMIKEVSIIYCNVNTIRYIAI